MHCGSVYRSVMKFHSLLVCASFRGSRVDSSVRACMKASLWSEMNTIPSISFAALLLKKHMKNVFLGVRAKKSWRRWLALNCRKQTFGSHKISTPFVYPEHVTRSVSTRHFINLPECINLHHVVELSTCAFFLLCLKKCSQCSLSSSSICQS